MGQGDWQLLAALLCVAGAGAVVLRRMLQTFRAPQHAGCAGGGCGKCPSAVGYAAGKPGRDTEARPLVTLQISASSSSGSRDERQ